MPTIILPINLIWHGSPHRATHLAQWIPMSAIVRVVSQRGFSSWTHEFV